METFKELVKKNRSIRRFDESRPLSEDILRELVDCVRFVASGNNKQPLRFRTVSDKTERENVFDTLSFAALYNDWNHPEKGEHPTGYIFILRDKELAKTVHHDDGIAAQTITLCATSMGLGACILQNCQYTHAFEALGIDKEKYAFSCVIALGYPIEKVVLEESDGENTRYWKTADQIQHVPKHSLETLLINN